MARGSVNKVILIGNLGNDPEVRYMNNGDPVCSFSLATTESWKDKNTGEKKEQTEWHRVVVYGKLAEIIEKYSKKGSQLYVEGRLRARKWTDAQDVLKTTVEIVANEVHILSNRFNCDEGRINSHQIADEFVCEDNIHENMPY